MKPETWIYIQTEGAAFRLHGYICLLACELVLSSFFAWGQLSYHLSLLNSMQLVDIQQAMACNDQNENDLCLPYEDDILS